MKIAQDVVGPIGIAAAAWCVRTRPLSSLDMLLVVVAANRRSLSQSCNGFLTRPWICSVFESRRLYLNRKGGRSDMRLTG